MTYRWTFGKDPLNLEKFCEQSTIKYDIIDYGVQWFFRKILLSKLVKVVRVD